MSTDPQLVLLKYRVTPVPWCMLNPAELCIGQHLKTLVLQSDHVLLPQWSYLGLFSEQNQKHRNWQKSYFDSHHKVRHFPEIPDNADVRIVTEGGLVEGKVLYLEDKSRS